MSDYSNRCLCVRQVRNRTKIYKHFSVAVGSHSSHNTIVQCTILFCRPMRYTSRSLQCFLALDVPLDAAHERPYDWMVNSDCSPWCFALHTLILLTTPRRSPTDIITLLNVFVVSMYNSWFSFTASSKHDSHGYVHAYFTTNYCLQ